MSMNPWFRGADHALARLGVGHGGHVGNAVGGMDYVGAARAVPRQAHFGIPLNFPAHAVAPGQYVAQPAFSGGKLEDLAQLSMAGKVPQILLGIGDTTTKVKAGATTSFSPEGSVPLRPTRFTVANSLAPFFAINQITVARLNLLAGSVAVPAEAFIAQAEQPPLEFPVVAAGSQVIVQVTNIDAADHIFLAQLAAIDLTTAAQRMNP